MKFITWGESPLLYGKTIDPDGCGGVEGEQMATSRCRANGRVDGADAFGGQAYVAFGVGAQKGDRAIKGEARAWGETGYRRQGGIKRDGGVKREGEINCGGVRGIRGAGRVGADGGSCRGGRGRAGDEAELEFRDAEVVAIGKCSLADVAAIQQNGSRAGKAAEVDPPRVHDKEGMSRGDAGRLEADGGGSARADQDHGTAQGERGFAGQGALSGEGGEGIGHR